MPGTRYYYYPNFPELDPLLWTSCLSISAPCVPQGAGCWGYSWRGFSTWAKSFKPYDGPLPPPGPRQYPLIWKIIEWMNICWPTSLEGPMRLWV